MKFFDVSVSGVPSFHDAYTLTTRFVARPSV
jgi:hypothetical protein